MKKTLLAQSVALACLATAAGGAQAVSFTQNDVTVDINGTINGNRHSGRNGDRQLAIHGDLDARSVIPAAPAG